MIAASKSSRSRFVNLGVRLAIGLALLAFIFSRYAEVESVGALLRSVNPAILAFAIFIAVCGEVITAYKWQLLVRYIGGYLPFLTAVKAAFIGMFYNNFFPGSVGGDIARVILVARYAGGKARATASAFMQRNTGLAGLFLVGIPASLLWPQIISWPDQANFLTGVPWLANATFWLVSAAIGYGLTNIMLFSSVAYQRLWSLARFEHTHPAPTPLHKGFVYFLKKVQRFHHELQGYRFWLPAALVLSAITQLIDISLVYTLGQALGIDVPFTLLLITVPVVTLANLLPVTINGIGLRETVYIAMMHSAGISATQAVALSLSHFGVILTLATLGGILHALSPSLHNAESLSLENHKA